VGWRGTFVDGKSFDFQPRVLHGKAGGEYNGGQYIAALVYERRLLIGFGNSGHEWLPHLLPRKDTGEE
jgi:hypothetical protein